jgi:arylsulfatase A-like enzyme
MKTLLVTVDAWRASHTSFAPSSERTDDAPPVPYTPNIAALAESGTVFTQAVSHGPATPYAFPALHTSSLPLSHGGYERIDESRTLTSEALSDAGWHCVGIHANPWLGERYGYARGYADYRDVGEFSLPFLDDIREGLISRFGLDHPVYRAAQYAYRYAQKPLATLGSGGSDEVATARKALRTAPDDSFVWVHLLTPHAPYTPAKEHREAMGVPNFEGSATKLSTRAQHDPDSLSPPEQAAVRRLYAASVRQADAEVGRILDAADDDTLVVVSADHGEALFEHGQVGHEPALYDELVRVPLVIRPPADHSVGATHVDTQVRHVDVGPTVLDYAGVDVPDSWVGRSLRPAIEGEAVGEELAVSEVASTATTPGHLDPDALQVAVRTPERKVVATPDGTVHGYDLVADAGEAAPVADPRGGEWSRLRDALSARLDEIEVGESAAVERDDETEQRLRDLGYLE